MVNLQPFNQARRLMDNSNKVYMGIRFQLDHVEKLDAWMSVLSKPSIQVSKARNFLTTITSMQDSQKYPFNVGSLALGLRSREYRHIVELLLAILRLQRSTS